MQWRQYRHLQRVYIYQYGLTELQAAAEAYKIRSIDDTFFGCQSGLYLYYPQTSWVSLENGKQVSVDDCLTWNPFDLDDQEPSLIGQETTGSHHYCCSSEIPLCSL